MTTPVIHSNLDHLNLQDSLVDGGEWINKDLVLYIESVQVKTDHPQNTFDVSKTAEGVQLKFLNCRVSSVSRFDDEGGSVDMSFDHMITDFEIFDVTFERLFDKKVIYKITGQCAFEHDSDLGEFTLTFDTVEIEWVNLDDDEWLIDFED